jgi:Cu-Zn family superoxide dismutase
MRHTIFLAGFLFVAGVVTPATAQMQTAKAELKGAKGEVMGTATFHEVAGGGVLIEANLSNLPPGTHAFHLHEKGACEGPDFKTAMGHFNPTGKQHGFLNPKGFHAGDMPNFEVPPGGKVKLTVVNTAVTLAKGAKNSLFQSGGTSLMVHHHADDYKSDPAGDAGARVACGVVTE